MSHTARSGGADVSSSADIIARLGELIDALDRRVPQIERAGEAQIAADSAALRRAALDRIEELTRSDSQLTR
jgi:hypothetical protein